MADDDRPAGGDGRRVLGRSSRAERRQVVVEGEGSGGAPAAPAPPAGAAPPPAPAPASPPGPVAPSAPPAGAGRPVRVIGRSSGSGAPVGEVAAPPAPPPRPPAGRGPAAPKPPRPPRRTRSGRRWARLVVVALVVLLAIPVGLFLFGWWQFSRIERVDVASALSPRAGRTGTNYLIVGTDTREGISPDDPNAGAFLDEGVSGSRTDTIMVLRVVGGSTQLLSIPRDLWVTDPATGEVGRINSTFAAGPANLITTVQQLGIPVDHYLEIDFVSFTKLVDALGGITIDFPAPARDANSGLLVEEAGPQRLDGSQALAYVRSRYYEELRDGQWVTDPTADLGRTERQRAFLTALLDGVTGERNPISLARVPGAVGGGMRIDDRLGYLEALGLGWDLRGSVPEAVLLPVTPRTTSGGAAILELQEPAAGEVIAGFAS